MILLEDNIPSQSVPAGGIRPLRVAIDVRILQGSDAFKGIGHYTRGLVEALLSLSARDETTVPMEIHLIEDRERPRAKMNFEGATDIHSVASPAQRRIPFFNLSLGISRDLCDLRRLLKSLKPDLFHVSSPLLGPFHWEVAAGVRTVATIYDLIPVLMREAYLDKWPVALQRLYKARMQELARLDGAIVISEAVGEDVQGYLGISVEKIRVAYPALRSLFFEEVPSEKCKRPSPYVLAFASPNPSKNTDILLDAWSQARPNYRLMLLVPDDAGYCQTLDEKCALLGVADSVELRLTPSDKELRRLYSEASLFVIPSLAEGFGFPAVEAAACGVAVLASDIPVFRETMGEAAAWFDPLSSGQLAEALDGLLARPDGLGRMGEAGPEIAKQYSWGKAAYVTAKFYAYLAHS